MEFEKHYWVYIFDKPTATVKRMTMSQIITYIKIFGDKYDVIVMDGKEAKDGQV